MQSAASDVTGTLNHVVNIKPKVEEGAHTRDNRRDSRDSLEVEEGAFVPSSEQDAQKIAEQLGGATAVQQQQPTLSPSVSQEKIE